MSLFVIGDTHLSFSSNKPMDIFKGWDGYTERLKTNWNRVVGENDSVVIPGDISWGVDFETALKDFEFLNSLTGTKYILKGNHDYWWNTLTKTEKFLSDNNLDTIKIIHNNAYAVDGFVLAGSRGWFYDDRESADRKIIMREAGRLRLSLKAAQDYCGELIAFLHYPPISETQICEEIVAVLEEFSVKRCYFGHLHGCVSPQNAKIKYNGIDFSLVSADYLRFCPRFVPLMLENQQK